MRLPRIAATFALVATTAVTAPAGAASSTTIGFGLSAGTYAPTGIACRLSVPTGANGITVLNAARAARCIVSYRTVSFGSYGTFVICINEVCGVTATGTTGTYWNMYENGVSTSYGVDGFRANPGDELVFAYQHYCFESVCPSAG